MVRLFAVLVFLQFIVTPTVHASCNRDWINHSVARAIGGVEFDQVHAAPAKGLCEATIGTRVFYVSEDGRYLFAGNLVSLTNGQNLTAIASSQLTRGILAGLDEKNMITIDPVKAKRTLTVFTDVDCPYCERLHQEVPELVRHGVRVRYLLYPRTGPDSKSYWRAVAVWCAKDRLKAIDKAMNGGSLGMKDCSNPVRDTYLLGRKLDIEGTPTIFTDDGTRIGGYVPAQQLLSQLGIRDKPLSQK